MLPNIRCVTVCHNSVVDFCVFGLAFCSACSGALRGWAEFPFTRCKMILSVRCGTWFWLYHFLVCLLLAFSKRSNISLCYLQCSPTFPATSGSTSGNPVFHTSVVNRFALHSTVSLLAMLSSSATVTNLSYPFYIQQIKQITLHTTH